MDSMEQNSPAPVSEQEDEISLIDLLATLLRHKRLIIGGTLLSALGVLLFSIISLVLPPDISYLPNQYQSKAVMLVNEQDGGGSLSAALSASGLGSLASMAGISAGGPSTASLAVLIATSKTTLDELNSQFNFTDYYEITKSPKTNTRKAILEHYTAALDEETGTLSIAFEDKDPELAAAVVNRAVEILDRRFISLGGNKALEQKRLLENKLADVQVEINKAEDEIKRFTARYGVVNIEALATEQITVLGRLRSELILKDMEIENYEKFSRIDDPVIRRLRNERSSLYTKIREMEEGGGSSLLPGQQQLPELAFEYAALQRDLMIQMEIFKLLTQQYELAKLNAEQQSPTFQILEGGEVPDEKSGPGRGLLCIIVTMAGFFLCIFLAFVLEAWNNVRQDPEAMAKLKGASR